VDRNLWAVPPIAFVVLGATLTAWDVVDNGPILMASMTPEARQPVFASITGTAGSLLGFMITSVAILAAFGPRTPRTPSGTLAERRVARARDRLTTCLLSTSVILLILLIVATVAIAIDNRNKGNSLITILTASSAGASLLGLLVSGAGVALTVVERNRTS
jgi:hypothetical protein